MIRKPFLERESVIFIPPYGILAKEAVERILRTTVKNIQAFLQENCQNEVK